MTFVKGKTTFLNPVEEYFFNNILIPSLRYSMNIFVTIDYLDIFVNRFFQIKLLLARLYNTLKLEETDSGYVQYRAKHFNYNKQA